VSVVAVEAIKIILSFIIVWTDPIHKGKIMSNVLSGGILPFVKLLVPSFSYSLLNNLIHYSLARLQVPHFQVSISFLSQSYETNLILMNSRLYIKQEL
jgi:hypothetical protein